MATWLDWYVRWRIEAPDASFGLARQMHLGATNPLMAFAEIIEDVLAIWTVDREQFARQTGLNDRKSQEELAVRAACMSPFLRGFAAPETRELKRHGRRPLGIVLTRETTSLLPGFKADQLVDVPIAVISSTDGLLWQAPLYHSALSKTLASTATVWTSSDRYLLQLAFEVHEPHGFGYGLIHQEGCEGASIRPIDQPP